MKIEEYLKNSLVGICQENEKVKAPFVCAGFTEFLLDQSDGNFDLQYIDRITNLIFVQPVGRPTYESVMLYGNSVNDFDAAILRQPMQVMIPSFLFMQESHAGLLDASQWEEGDDLFHRLKIGENVREKFKNFVLKF